MEIRIDGRIAGNRTGGRGRFAASAGEACLCEETCRLYRQQIHPCGCKDQLAHLTFARPARLPHPTASGHPPKAHHGAVLSASGPERNPFGYLLVPPQRCRRTGEAREAAILAKYRVCVRGHAEQLARGGPDSGGGVAEKLADADLVSRRGMAETARIGGAGGEVASIAISNAVRGKPARRRLQSLSGGP